MGDLDSAVRKHLGVLVCVSSALRECVGGAAVWPLISGVAYLVLDACHGNLFVLRFAFSCHKCRRRTFVTFPLHFYFNNSPSIYGMYNVHTYFYS